MKYNIILKGKTIGSVVTTKKNIGNIQKYTISSKAKVNFFYKVNVDFNVESNYQGEYLAYGHAKNIVNDEVREEATTTTHNEAYKVINHKNETWPIDEKITYSLPHLYFKEPKGIDKVYSETYGAFCKIEKTESNTYKLQLPNDKSNYYVYKDGICSEIIVPRNFAELTFVLVSD